MSRDSIHTTPPAAGAPLLRQEGSCSKHSPPFQGGVDAKRLKSRLPGAVDAGWLNLKLSHHPRCNAATPPGPPRCIALGVRRLRRAQARFLPPPRRPSASSGRHPSSGRRGIHFVRHSYESYLTVTNDNQTKRAENNSRPSVWLAMTGDSRTTSHASPCHASPCHASPRHDSSCHAPSFTSRLTMSRSIMSRPSG